MREFKFLSYYTEYACAGDFDIEMQSEICFRDAFIHLYEKPISESYKIIVHKGTDFAKSKRRSNACLLTLQQVKNHLKQAQRVEYFKYKVTENVDNEGYPIYIIDLSLENVIGTFHKYLLTWVRYLYEFPYNMFIVDAYRLKREKEFRFESIANLFNIVLGGYVLEPNEGHQIAYNQINEPLKISELRSKIHTVSKLYEIYERLKYKYNKYKVPEEIDGKVPLDIEYWSEEYYKKYRKRKYMLIYKNVINKK